MFMFYEYVRDDESLDAINKPCPELGEITSLEYCDELEALEIHNTTEDTFYAPIDKESAACIMREIGSIGANANVLLRGVIIYESDEDGVLWDGNKAAKALVAKCREQTYKVSRL